ncbi:MAG: DUF4123 domain-containing protein, partial [Litoreibacter sp.]
MANGSSSGSPAKRSGPRLEQTLHKNVQLLDIQRGVHPRRTVPEALQDLIFPPGETDTVLYAILDAAKIDDLQAVLEDAIIPHRRLFTGDEEEGFGDVAPWLVVLSEVDTLTRLLFTHLEGEDTPWNIARFEPGILFRASPDFDAVWNHWRGFYRMKLESGSSYYFRFWEPACMAAYLNYIKNDADRVTQWFCREGAGIDQMFLLENRPLQWLLTEIEAVPKKYTQPCSRDGKPLTLTAGEVGAISQARLERDIEEVARRIEKTFGAHLDEDRPKDMVFQRVQGLFGRMMPAGIKQLDHLYLLACWEVFYGPRFEEKDPQDELRKICLSPAQEAKKV